MPCVAKRSDPGAESIEANPTAVSGLERNDSPDEQAARGPYVAARSVPEAESIEANSTAVSGLERSDSPDEHAAPRSVVRDEWPVLAVEIVRRKPTKIANGLKNGNKNLPLSS